MRMTTRREAIRVLGAGAAAVWRARADGTPRLAPGTPLSAERTALIEAFRVKSEGLEKSFEARSFKSDWTMPYRLFRPKAAGKLPLVVYLHGSGGLGDDNEKQLGLGNIFGTRVWLLPENQKKFPCFVAAPQTDRGWIRYDLSQAGSGPAQPIPGLGDGARAALGMVASLCRELPIDERRIYVTGQSMGGAGTWHIIAQQPKLFAAAVVCCGSPTNGDAIDTIRTPVWNFHGGADDTVPVALSRERMAAMRKAGASPIYTEYAGVGHNVWQWAYTEPELLPWLFGQTLGNR